MKAQPNRFPLSPIITTFEKSLASTPWQILKIDHLIYVTLGNSSTREVLKLKFRTHAPNWIAFITQSEKPAKPTATVYEALMPGKVYAATTGPQIPAETFRLFIEPIQKIWDDTARRTRKPSIEITHRGTRQVTARACLAFSEIQVKTGRSRSKPGNIAVDFLQISEPNQPEEPPRHFVREPGAAEWLSVDLPAALDSSKGEPGQPLQMAVAPCEWEWIAGEVDKLLTVTR